MKPILVSSGEPAGIGPDLCLALLNVELPFVLLGSFEMFEERIKLLGKNISLVRYSQEEPLSAHRNTLVVYDVPIKTKVVPGQPDIQNASYVLNLLSIGVHACLQGEFSALVTGPVHKGLLNDAGIPFTGHTEFLQKECGVDRVVMLLHCDKMRVALVTTHLPLRKVPDQITIPRVREIIHILNTYLQKDFGLENPRILVAGLNPHAGEGGHLGDEEQTILTPAIQSLKKEGLNVSGPYSADTLFTEKYMKEADVFLAMYHDQGLPVLKHASFGKAVNVTLGLPIIRTSVDHGTAFELAGTGKACPSSLIEALHLAHRITQTKSAVIASEAKQSRAAL